LQSTPDPYGQVHSGYIELETILFKTEVIRGDWSVRLSTDLIIEIRIDLDLWEDHHLRGIRPICAAFLEFGGAKDTDHSGEKVDISIMSLLLLESIGNDYVRVGTAVSYEVRELNMVKEEPTQTLRIL
jgi:hypothetical protein